MRFGPYYRDKQNQNTQGSFIIKVKLIVCQISFFCLCVTICITCLIVAQEWGLRTGITQKGNSLQVDHIVHSWRAMVSRFGAIRWMVISHGHGSQ